MFDDLAELIAMYDEGAWSRGDFWYRVSLLIPDISVQTVHDQLPDGLRGDFVKWARAHYDNEVPANELVSVSVSMDNEGARTRIEAFRAWLRTNPP